MARRKRVRRKKAPTAIVVRQAAPVVVRRRSRARRVGRAIVGRVRKARGSPVVGRAMKQGLEVAVAAGTGALTSWALKEGKLPTRIAGVESSFVLATACSLIPLVATGTVGRVVGDAGVALAAISSYKLMLGTKFYIADQTAGWDGDEGY